MKIFALASFLVFSLSSPLSLASDPPSDGHGEGHLSEGGPHWKTFKAQKPAKSSYLPVELIAQVKDSYRDKKLEKKFLSVEMYLFDQHQVISPPVKVITPLGGGEVNLASFIPEGQAKFKVRVELKKADGEVVIPDQVYFVPGISHQSDGEEVHCGSYFDITDVFKKQIMTEKGMETYLTKGLFQPLLSGSYLFVKQSETELLLGNLNLMDSRHNGESCIRKKPSK